MINSCILCSSRIIFNIFVARACKLYSNIIIMRTFLKNVFASVVGIFVSIMIIVAVFAAFFFIKSKSNSYKLKENSVLSINLNGILKDKAQPNPVLEYLGLKEANEIALADILSSIRKAKENDKIKGIYINSGIFTAPYASLLEIRNELIDFKKSGKFIIAYSDTYLQGGYYVSSVADKVVLNPIGNLDLHGIASQRTFYKGLLDNLGIEIQVFKVGTYKSAVEPYILDKMSAANKEQVSSYANNIWNTILSGISKSRNIPVEKLNEITDTLPLFLEPDLIVKNRLVDTLMYEKDIKGYLATLVGIENTTALNIATIGNMKTVNFEDKKNYPDKIAVLYAEGSIVSGNNSEDINDRYYIKQIEKLKENKDIKAVVLRVNSPGGSAYASEQIWKAVADLKAVKPVVVSMGGYAASGGYYISCNASKIIAQPSTLTGSIGIFGMFPNVEGLTKKIGLTFDNVKTNKFSDFGDFSRPMKEDEKAILQKYIERGYDTFLTRCSEGRGISKDSIAQIAEGRVWTGEQALKIGLVDGLGGLDDAIKEAANLASLENYSVTEYPRQKDFWEEIINNNKTDIALNTLKEYLGDDLSLFKTIREIKEMKEQDFIQARLPYNFEIR